MEGQRQWRKTGAKAAKTKYIYKTMDEVLEEGKWRKINVDAKDSSSFGKVIDMTGKEQRVLTHGRVHAASMGMSRAFDLKANGSHSPT